MESESHSLTHFSPISADLGAVSVKTAPVGKGSGLVRERGNDTNGVIPSPATSKSQAESIARIRAILREDKRISHTFCLAHIVGIWPT